MYNLWKGFIFSNLLCAYSKINLEIFKFVLQNFNTKHTKICQFQWYITLSFGSRIVLVMCGSGKGCTNSFPFKLFFSFLQYYCISMNIFKFFKTYFFKKKNLILFCFCLLKIFLHPSTNYINTFQKNKRVCLSSHSLHATNFGASDIYQITIMQLFSYPFVWDGQSTGGSPETSFYDGWFMGNWTLPLIRKKKSKIYNLI